MKELKLYMSGLGITDDDFERVLDRCNKYLEDLGLSNDPEIDSQLSKEKHQEISREIKSYMSGEHTLKETYSLLLKKYTDAGVNTKQADERVFGLLTLATILPYELFYFLERKEKTMKYTA